MQPSSAKTTAHLLQRALAGDGQAERELVKLLMPIVIFRTRRAISRAAARGLELPDDQDDFVQEVFTTLLKDERDVLRRWDPCGGLSLQNWVGMICERRVLQLIQASARRYSRIAFSAPDEGYQCDPSLLLGEALSLLRAIKRSASEDAANLFMRLCLLQEDIHEIARELQLQDVTIYALRQKLAEQARALLAHAEGRSHAPTAGKSVHP